MIPEHPFVALFFLVVGFAVGRCVYLFFIRGLMNSHDAEEVVSYFLGSMWVEGADLYERIKDNGIPVSRLSFYLLMRRLVRARLVERKIELSQNPAGEPIPIKMYRRVGPAEETFETHPVYTPRELLER